MTLYIDFHGVLTDGKLHMAHDGKTMFESVHHRDITAIRELVARGFDVTIVTASDSPIIASYCEKVGCSRLVLRDKSNLPHTPFFAIGDSTWDIPMLEQAIQAYCPADADESVRNLPDIYVLNANGGHGCLAELVKILCSSQPFYPLKHIRRLLEDGPEMPPPDNKNKIF